jgi:hypothetical protein
LALATETVPKNEVVNNKTRKVVVFIDPRERLKSKRADEWAHPERQRL